MVHDLLAWLSALPTALLYAAILVAAFAENVFPPLPADSVIALGAFAAAQGHGSMFGAWSATMIGNLGGAMLMFAVGKRFGMPYLQHRFPSLLPAAATQQFVERVERRGLIAVLISRFIPGVRAVVPPVAGALGMRAIPAALVMTVASGAWYGAVCWLAFRAGANAEGFVARLAVQQRLVAISAAGIAVVAISIWIWKRRSRRAPPS